MEQMWSTEDLPVREQFAHWQEVVAEAFVPVRVQHDDAGDGAFRSAVRARQVGPLGVSRIASVPQSVLRTEAMVQQSPGDTVFLNLPLAGGSFARQDGRTATLGGGDFAIVDSTRPFELGFAQPFVQVSVALPGEVLRAHGVVAQATATRIDGSRGLGAVASGALRAFARDTSAIDRQSARAVADHLCGLIALALNEQIRPEGASAHAKLMAAALAEVDTQLADLQLGPRDVAERIAVSPRYLHRLFSESGTTFGRCLLQRRLARGHSSLNDPRRAHLSIAEIAHEVGFADPSYFARAFKIHYGMTPRQARQAVG